MVSNDSLIFITGRYRNTLDFDPSTSTHSHSSTGDSDWYITSYISDYCAGTYSDTLFSSFLCDSIIITELFINTVDTSTQNGSTLTADASGATYQWLSCPAMTTISGATGQSYTATANGDYAVIIISNGCIGKYSLNYIELFL